MRDFKNEPRGLEVNITSYQSTLVQGDTLLALDYCGDGFYGPYDPEDSDDIPFLRMSAYRYRASDQSWQLTTHGGWVTALPAMMPLEHQLAALTYLLQRLYYAITVDDVRELGAELSWIDPSWFLHQEDALVEVEVEVDETPYAPAALTAKLPGSVTLMEH